MVAATAKITSSVLLADHQRLRCCHTCMLVPRGAPLAPETHDPRFAYSQVSCRRLAIAHCNGSHSDAHLVASVPSSSTAMPLPQDSPPCTTWSRFSVSEYTECLALAAQMCGHGQQQKQGSGNRTEADCFYHIATLRIAVSVLPMSVPLPWASHMERLLCTSPHLLSPA